MRLNKAQSIVITLMNVLIVALVAVILFVPGATGKNRSEPTGGEAVTPPEDDPPPEVPQHNKFRSATDGKTDDIVRETRLMGNGDETVVKVFFRDGVSYIFGNATVKGLDFDEYGGFLCIVNGAGTILSYTYFGGNITAACIMPEGYAVAAGDALFTVDYAGNKKKAATLDGEAVWLSPENFGIAAVTQPSPTSLKYTEFAENGDVYSQARSTRIDSGFTLEFFDCYSFFGDTKTISARTYRLPLYDSIGFFTFEPGGSADAYYYGDSAQLSVKPYAVMPYAKGYCTVVSRNGVAAILSVDYGFNGYRVSSFGYSFTAASLMMVGGTHYVSFCRNDGAVTYTLDENLSYARAKWLDGIMPQASVKTASDEILFGGQVYELSGGARTSVALGFSSQSGKLVSLDVEGGTVYAMEHTEQGTIAVVSATGGTALSTPTSGKDVYVLLLRD